MWISTHSLCLLRVSACFCRSTLLFVSSDRDLRPIQALQSRTIDAFHRLLLPITSWNWHCWSWCLAYRAFRQSGQLYSYQTRQLNFCLPPSILSSCFDIRSAVACRICVLLVHSVGSLRVGVAQHFYQILVWPVENHQDRVISVCVSSHCRHHHHSSLRCVIECNQCCHSSSHWFYTIGSAYATDHCIHQISMTVITTTIIHVNQTLTNQPKSTVNH